MKEKIEGEFLSAFCFSLIGNYAHFRLFVGFRYLFFRRLFGNAFFGDA